MNHKSLFIFLTIAGNVFGEIAFFKGGFLLSVNNDKSSSVKIIQDNYNEALISAAANQKGYYAGIVKDDISFVFFGKVKEDLSFSHDEVRLSEIEDSQPLSTFLESIAPGDYVESALSGKGDKMAIAMGGRLGVLDFMGKRFFTVNFGNHVEGLKWSPDDDVICLFDTGKGFCRMEFVDIKKGGGCKKCKKFRER